MTANTIKPLKHHATGAIHWLKMIASTLCCVIILAGCNGKEPLSNYARPGDTIAIAATGTRDFNSGKPVYLRKEDLTLQINCNGNIYTPKIRHVLRVYGDTSSSLIMENSFSHILGGQWSVVIDLVDELDNPLTMTPCTAEVNLQYPGLTFASQQLEILSGIGASNDFPAELFSNQLHNLEPQPHLLISTIENPFITPPTTSLAAAEFIIEYKDSDFIGTKPTAVKITQHSNIQMLSSVTDATASGYKQLKILITNPYGFVQNPPVTDRQKTASYNELPFIVAWNNFSTETINDTNWQNSIHLVSATFYDVNINEITTLTGTAELAQD